MKHQKRLLEFSFLLMAILGGLLLTISLGQSRYLLVGGLGVLAGLLVVDWLGWLKLPVWVANIVSFAVLYLSMRGFFSTETSGQLGAVANLLVYLQALLVLQEKTPRQYWQLLVLNFLQIVVASVFNMQLEGGLLFLMYMATSAVFLISLNAWTVQLQARGPGNQAADKALATGAGRAGAAASRGMPLTLADPSASATASLGPLLRHVTAWFGACFAFAAVLFVLIPRTESAWVSGRRAAVTIAGGSRKVELDVRGRINLDYTAILRATFRKARGGPGVELASPPYFRSMALGSLVIENGISAWKAPFDRVYSFSWWTVPSNSQVRRPLFVEITQEPVGDPLVNTVEPFLSDPEYPMQLRHNADLGLVSRSESDAGIDLLPFNYRFQVASDGELGLHESFPWQHHLPDDRRIRSMADNPAELKWLTALERQRYPGLIAIADQLAAEGSPDRRELARRFERWFLEAGRFTYTLDYTSVPRREGVDPVEDFVTGHRKGHCTLFASALAIMLRSQGIPARLAVGFYGGLYNETTKTYYITGGHAHAWVEAYLRPEDCTEEMSRFGAAGPGGAWLRLDATPPSDLRDEAANRSDAINLARSFWQEYVLRMEPGKQLSWGEYASSVVAGALDLSAWSDGVESVIDSVRAQPLMWVIVASSLVLVGGLAFAAVRARRKGHSAVAPVREGLARVRRLLGSALGKIAPPLGRWVLGSQGGAGLVPFWQRLTTELARHDTIRQPSETYREFAHRATQSFSDRPSASQIGPTLNRLVERYQRVRFGHISLDEPAARDAETDVRQLAEWLREAPARPPV